MSVKKGSKLPDFSLNDQNDAEFKSLSLHGSPCVIFFYPAAFTPTCTKEACSFQDKHETFKAKNVKIVGISSDTVLKLKQFEKEYGLGYKLLSDEKRVVRKLFGVPGSLLGLLDGRVTYVFDKDGICINVFNSQLSSSKHVTEAIKKLDEV